MSALQEWLDFRADLAHEVSRDGFCAAWRQMTSGQEPPPAAVHLFGKTVVRLFIHAVDDCEVRGYRPPSIDRILDDALKTGLLCGFNPKDYGYDITIRQIKAPKEQVH